MTAIADLLMPANPGLVLILAGGLAALLPAPIARVAAVGLPAVLLVYLFGVEFGSHSPVDFLDRKLDLFHLDALGRTFAALFLAAAMLGGLYAAGDDTGPLERAAVQVLAGSAVAAVCTGDLASLFIFFELAVIASVFLIWVRGTERARAAGMRYMVLQVLAGVTLLEGILSHASVTGSIALGHLGTDAPGGAVILAGLGIAGAFPLVHSWLQDAYPESTPGGTVVLSVFTTTLAIYVLARCFAGTGVLVSIGTVMALFPILFALLENDVRRVLAWGLIAQLGFMVAGIGVGTASAVNGAVLHAVSHVFSIMVLFMATGAVLLRTGTARITELGGLGSGMPFTAGLCLVGAASLAAVPLFGGFVSQPMIIAAAGDTADPWIWPALTVAAAGLVYAIAVRVPVLVFFTGGNGRTAREAPVSMLVAMTAAAALCVAIGLFPGSLSWALPFPLDDETYAAGRIIPQLQLVLFAMLAYAVLLLLRIDPPATSSVTLDVDWIYRRGLGTLALRLARLIDRGWGRLTAGLVDLVRFVIVDSWRHFGPLGRFGRAPGTGTGVAWIALLLLVTLVAGYVTG